ncbi:hypothetical protein PQO03_08145 [Lentisphaera profundi]|uniref:Uncharacterized protein n=1 Tax=Lentisphaera profundi TaxID=1658616 RepID=A0ABY7VPE8_9BACT|nr:hypothetical protein [Lentisphaera profundi]WDE95686.1 hypothetical protein PQO03_08145 [Lentisphaera profundi]
MKYILCIMFMSVVMAQDLKMTSAFIKQHGALKVSSQSMVMMNVNFENKTNKQQDVELLFFNSSYPLNTWEYKFSLAAKSHSSRDFPFKLDADCREMKLQFKQGKKLINQTNMKVFVKNIVNVVILDNPIDQNGLKSSFLKASQRSVNTIDQIPMNWADLKSVDLLIINKPSKSQLNKAALDIVSQYVNNGGSLLVSHPDTIEHMYDTGYGYLLPAKILSLSQRNASRVMLKKGFEDLKTTQSFDFMRVKLFDDSYVMLKDKKDVLVAARPVGLGLSFFYAVPLAQKSLGPHSEDISEFLNFFLSYSRRLVLPSDNGDPSLERYTSSLSGMIAPNSSKLFMILLVYGLTVFTIFLLARVFKKVQYSWFVVGLVSVCFSAYLILGKDKMINVPKESKRLKVEYSHQVNSGIKEIVHSFYEVKAGKLSFSRDMAKNRIVNVSTYEEPKSAGQMASSRLNITQDTARKSEVDIESLNVNFLKISADKNTLSLDGTEVEAETWRSFVEWSMNPELESNKYLELILDESGIASSIEGDMLLGKNGVYVLKEDDFNAGIIKPLLEDQGRSQVMLFKREHNEDTEGLLVYPVRLKAKNKKILVPEEFVGINFTDFQRLWDINKKMYTKTAVGGRHRCGFRVQVPVELSGLKVSEIQVAIDLDSAYPVKYKLVDGSKRKDFTGKNLTYKLPKAKDVNELYFDLEIIFEDKSQIQTVKEFKSKEFKISLKGELP